VKALFVVTAIIEVGAGIALLVCPLLLAIILLGAPLITPAALTVARVCGAGLLSLGVACWLSRSDSRSPAANGLLAAMLIYNAAVVAIFVYAALGFGLHGVALWPAVAVHAAMAVWCGANILPIIRRLANPVMNSSAGETKPQS